MLCWWLGLFSLQRVLLQKVRLKYMQDELLQKELGGCWIVHEPRNACL
jgi:hypothetical protein